MKNKNRNIIHGKANYNIRPQYSERTANLTGGKPVKGTAIKRVHENDWEKRACVLQSIAEAYVLKNDNAAVTRFYNAIVNAQRTNILYQWQNYDDDVANHSLKRWAGFVPIDGAAKNREKYQTGMQPNVRTTPWPQNVTKGLIDTTGHTQFVTVQNGVAIRTPAWDKNEKNGKDEDHSIRKWKFEKHNATLNKLLMNS